MSRCQSRKVQLTRLNIFISHTHKDKPIVEPIARALMSVYGQDQVFYDSWSIKPGDGIIDKMNDALEDCSFFFFFVSKNSLTSAMVRMEWQNALMATASKDLKFVPVKLDDCQMPAILMQKLYIDIYRNGLQTGIRQIVDVVSGNNTHHDDGEPTFHNLKVYVTPTETFQLDLEIRAEVYMEPASRYAVVSENANAKVWCTSDSVAMTGRGEPIEKDDGKTLYPYFMTVSRATSPGFPVRISVADETHLNVAGIMHVVSETDFEMLPAISVLPDRIFHLGGDVEIPLYEILGSNKSQDEIAEIVQKSIVDSLSKGK